MQLTSFWPHLVLLKVVGQHSMAPQDDLPALRLLLPQYQPQQRALPRPIWTNERQLLATLDLQGRLVEQHLKRKDEANMQSISKCYYFNTLFRLLSEIIRLLQHARLAIQPFCNPHTFLAETADPKLCFKSAPT